MAHYGSAQGSFLQLAGLHAAEAPGSGFFRLWPDHRAWEAGWGAGDSPGREEVAQVQGAREAAEGLLILSRRRQPLVVGLR